MIGFTLDMVRPSSSAAFTQLMPVRVMNLDGDWLHFGNFSTRIGPYIIFFPMSTELFSKIYFWSTVRIIRIGRKSKNCTYGFSYPPLFMRNRMFNNDDDDE